MKIIDTTLAPGVTHECIVPSTWGIGEGSTWECPDCSSRWEMNRRSPSFGYALVWLKLNSRGRVIGWYDSERYPRRRRPEPSAVDKRRDTDVRPLLAALRIAPAHLDAIRWHNPSAAAPYHNYQHLISVALNADAGLVHEGVTDIATRQIAATAALWHDFDHLAGDHDDGVNISRAVAGFERFAGALGSMTDEERASIRSGIKATRMPHDPALADNIVGRVLQDADMLQTLEPDGDRWRLALAEESGRSVTPESDAVFMSGIQWNTQWAQQRFALHRAVQAA